MVLFILIGLLAFLYFKGQSQQAAIEAQASAATTKTAASGANGSQGVANDATYQSLLMAISEGLKLANKVADTQVQKN